MTLFGNKIKTTILLSFGALFLMMSSCKKGTFDINSPNPNAPSPETVPVKYTLSAALAGTATHMLGGNSDMFTGWDGYWSQSGDYTPSPTFVLYQINTDTYSGNWDNGYLNLINYNVIINHALTDSTLGNYLAAAMIMKSFVYQRIVDIYNDAPYSDALTLKNFTPKYDGASDIYDHMLNQIDSAITMIKNPSPNAEAMDQYDVLFGGDMTMWLKFANTLKLKILMRLTQTSGGDAKITSALSGLTDADFLGAGENAAINPGYSSASDAQQSPLWNDIGYTASGAQAGNNIYFRANTYSVDFFTNDNDTFRLRQIYEVKSDGGVYGKQYGSNLLGEHNSNISGVNGKGVVKSSTQDAIILPATESLFLVAEAQLRGYLPGNAAATYQSAVEESFTLLGVANPVAEADTYLAQSAFQFTGSNAQKLNTLITQKWAAMNPFDALEAYSDWRRLGIPTDLPVSVYPGNTATHIPYRLEYPTSEHSYNSTNVPTIDVMTNKIFWMP